MEGKHQELLAEEIASPGGMLNVDSCESVLRYHRLCYGCLMLARLLLFFSGPILISDRNSFRRRLW
jgi:hypothetical protein